MARWEQYEVWVRSGEVWDLLGSFADMEPAGALVSARRQRVRLLHVLFEDSKRLEEQTIAEIGATK
jgi:hypothetical protein